MKILWVLLYALCGSTILLPALAAGGGTRGLPPNQVERARAALGAGMIAVAIYLALHADYLLGPDFWQTGGAWVWWVAVPWALLAGGGVLSLVVGARRSDGERDILEFVWRVAQIVAGGLLLRYAYVPAFHWMAADAPGEINFLLTAVYLWVLVNGVMHLLLMIRRTGSSLAEVEAQQAHGRGRAAAESETASRPAPRPRRFET
jgi:hypothetical protein